MHAVELEGVTKRFDGREVVSALNLNVKTGAILGFIGPNGSGKTTTLRMMLRILHPDQGRIHVLGHHTGRAADDRVGYLPEERGLYRKMKVRDAIAFHAALKGVRPEPPQVSEQLQRLGLSGWEGKPVMALSKGMMQKVQFLTATVHRPDLLVLDEPLSGLDPVAAELIEGEILEIRRAGATVIFSTHDMTAAERLCDTICMIHKGKKMLDGTLAAIRAEHGQHTLKVGVDRFEGTWEQLPGVAGFEPADGLTALRLRPGADPDEILRALVAVAKVHHFEVARPTLREIFVRIAGTSDPNRGEVADA